MPHHNLIESATNRYSHSSSLRMLSKSKAAQHRRTASDKSLLYVFLTAVFLVTASLFAVQLPQDLIDHPALNHNHDVGMQQSSPLSSRRKSVVVQYTDDKIPPDPVGPASKPQPNRKKENVQQEVKQQTPPQKVDIKKAKQDQKTPDDKSMTSDQKRNRNASYHVVISTGCSTFQVLLNRERQTSLCFLILTRWLFFLILF